ncbi:MAG: ligase-associated DNA damage response DEXH box helicase [Opitutales bacterium]
MTPQQQFNGWFTGQGWKPFTFQKQTWKAFRDGESGLIHAPTGLGKTLAAWGGPLLEIIRSKPTEAVPLKVLWITPLRALAGDTVQALQRPATELGLPVLVEKRTGDTSASAKKRQRQRYPTALVTTPESLSLLLSYPETRDAFATLEATVVDEWHELLGTKRGVQTELALARLRDWFPKLRTWGLSATLGNLDEALAVLLGSEQAQGRLIRGRFDKKIVIETLLPSEMETFPWSGHLGLKLLDEVVESLEQARTSLVFTNTRSQTEAWFQALLRARPDWKDVLAIHHGSLEREERDAVEADLAAGKLRAVVCTSSLDLGVDFTPVDQVLQVGSPKGIARLTQRAGRSGHQPGSVSRIVGAPTNAFELVEFAAARDAMERGEIEARRPLIRPLDVLLQHLVTCALGTGFKHDALLREVRSTHAYADLTDDEWKWAVDFSHTGGDALQAYPDYHRLSRENGRYFVANERIARRHRMSIGTITSDSAVAVKLAGGRTLGTVEEYFISRLSPGDRFTFAGRQLQLIRIKGLVAQVRQASSKGRGAVPSWQGGRSPLSTELAEAVCRKMEEADADTFDGPEMRHAREILLVQREWSELPTRDRFLCEAARVKGVSLLFCYSFAGRLVNEGLATLAAWRLSRQQPLTLRITANDYGFSLQARKKFDVSEELIRNLLTPDELLDHLLSCMNAAELARRQFREVARVAGLVLQGFPGQRKGNRELQASSGLIYEVFERYDPQNLLLDQAKREILDRQLELTRLSATIDRLVALPIRLKSPKKLTPLCFPLWADQLSQRLTSESWEARVREMVAQLEEAAEAVVW